MVIRAFLFALVVSLSVLQAETYILDEGHEEELELSTAQAPKVDLLEEKIKALIGEKAYARHSKFVKIIFADKEGYYINDRVDVAKVIQTLKDNGLLDLFFNKPQAMHLTFHSSGYPIFFVKIMSDTLQSMGYYRFITEQSKQDESGFFWTIRLMGEYAIDPVLLESALQKRGCSIVDIDRHTKTEWSYHIDIKKAYLMLEELRPYKERVLKKSLYEHWVNVKSTNAVSVWSLKGNNWYPYVSIYDKELHLLKVYKRDRKTSKIKLELPEDTAYIKIADLYSLKNIKEGLRIQAHGVK